LLSLVKEVGNLFKRGYKVCLNRLVASSGEVKKGSQTGYQPFVARQIKSPGKWNIRKR
jgi:hypothetical protein